MLSTSFTLGGTLPKVPERKKKSCIPYTKPKYSDFGSRTLLVEKQTPDGLFINEYLDSYKVLNSEDLLTTSLHSRSKDLQPRIILQSPMLTSTPRGDSYPPSDTAISRGHFDQFRTQFLPPKGKVDTTDMGHRNRIQNVTNMGLSQANLHISRIQCRPLPSPTSSYSSKTENVYLSPKKWVIMTNYSCIYDCLTF